MCGYSCSFSKYDWKLGNGKKKKRYHKTLFHIGIISLVSLAVGRQLLDII